MHIYLVRVRQRPDQSLYLEHKPNATTDDDFIAISHVWGTPETVEDTVVDGHPGVVKPSPVKRDRGILSILSRSDICGFGWFWMDLFCIDQTESSTISIADQLMSIPHVYKSARCVKVLLEHPICADWHATAVDLLISNNWDLDSKLEGDIGVREIEHTARCGPHMVCFDPWFERLWTRQDGLYGKVLDIVALNVIPCPCNQNQFDVRDQWTTTRNFCEKKSATFVFMYDKRWYHGVTSFGTLDVFQTYVDLVYRFMFSNEADELVLRDMGKRHLDIVSKYGGVIGPADIYNPFLSAWKSGRVSTKPRDYVLAVFPDMPGYIPPPDMRTMTFAELLANALSQAPIRLRYDIIPKVPSGLLTDEATPLEESIAPWIFKEPESITHAFDTFLVKTQTDPTRPPGIQERPFPALRIPLCNATVEDIQLNLEELPRIRMLCSEMSPMQRRLGPLMASSDQGPEVRLLWYYFDRNLLPPDPKDPRASDWYIQDMESSDVFNNVPEVVFAEELRRFLVSVICGTSLTTTDVILQHARPCILSTPLGKYLATLCLEKHEGERPQEVALLCPLLVEFRGFLVVSRTGATTTAMIGRTVIPPDRLLEALAGPMNSLTRLAYIASQNAGKRHLNVLL